MSDPNDKQKCGTCGGAMSIRREFACGSWTNNPCPSCAPRADGSAAEVKLPVGVAAAVKDAERIRLKAAMGKILGVPELHIIDLDDYSHTLASRVAELERDAARLKLQHSELATAANNLLTRKLGINEERLVLRVRESDFDALCAALSKGAQP